MKVKVKVVQSCLTLYDPMDYTVHGILQARILECVVVPFSRGSSQLKDQTQVSHIAGGFFTRWVIPSFFNILTFHYFVIFSPSYFLSTSQLLLLYFQLSLFSLSPWHFVFISEMILPFLPNSFWLYSTLTSSLIGSSVYCNYKFLSFCFWVFLRKFFLSTWLRIFKSSWSNML